MTLVLYVALYALMAYTVIDVARTPRELVRPVPKALWIIGVLLFGPVAPALWFVAGRPQSPWRRRRTRSARQQHPAYGQPDALSPRRFDSSPTRFGGQRAAQRPLGPDDDPEFLQELSDRLRRGNPDGPTPRP